MLNRARVPANLLHFVLYAMSLRFDEIPHYQAFDVFRSDNRVTAFQWFTQEVITEDVLGSDS